MEDNILALNMEEEVLLPWIWKKKYSCPKYRKRNILALIMEEEKEEIEDIADIL